MNKHWAVLLLAIAATQAVAGEKEYTVKKCEVLQGWYANRINDCSKCKESDGAKALFKVNKHLNSVMEIIEYANGKGLSSVIENCKIFDENNFKCTTEQEADYFKDYFNLGMLDELVVSNGKWEHTNIMRGMHFGKYGKDLKKGEHVTPQFKNQVYNCGYEKKWF